MTDQMIKKEWYMMKEPESLIQIVDEALEILDKKIDSLRILMRHTKGVDPLSKNGQIVAWMKDYFEFSKDLRDLLKLSENFRDD